MTRDLIPWLCLFALSMVLARWIARREERRAPQPRTIADALAEQSLPSNVVPLRQGPNRKKGVA